VHPVRYTTANDVTIAYQVVGGGDVDLIVALGAVTNLDVNREEPAFDRFLNRLGSFSRLILFDKRGVGLSDRVEDGAALEERMDDLRAVMDAAGSAQAVVLGISEGASASALFAVTHPGRTKALILYGAGPICPGAPDDPDSFPARSKSWATTLPGWLCTCVSEFSHWRRRAKSSHPAR
jgi:pimeloyl-ACP methyl ester carboxylesterase